MTLPQDDEPIHRHQFYATVETLIGNNTQAMQALNCKLDILTTSHGEVRDSINASETRNKMLISIVVGVWAAVSGSSGWYVQRSLDNFDRFAQRVEVAEKKIQQLETVQKQQESLPANVDATKRIATETQRRMDTLEDRGVKK